MSAQKIHDAIVFYKTFKDHPERVKLYWNGKYFVRQPTTLITRVSRTIMGDASRETILSEINTQVTKHTENIYAVMREEKDLSRPTIPKNSWMTLIQSINEFNSGLKVWSSNYPFENTLLAQVDAIISVTMPTLISFISQNIDAQDRLIAANLPPTRFTSNNESSLKTQTSSPIPIVHKQHSADDLDDLYKLPPLSLNDSRNNPSLSSPPLPAAHLTSTSFETMY